MAGIPGTICAGDMEKAAAVFNRCYQETLAQCRQDRTHGCKIYLRRGQRVTYHNDKTDQTETITARKSGYVTLPNANPPIWLIWKSWQTSWASLWTAHKVTVPSSPA